MTATEAEIKAAVEEYIDQDVLNDISEREQAERKVVSRRVRTATEKIRWELNGGEENEK